SVLITFLPAAVLLLGLFCFLRFFSGEVDNSDDAGGFASAAFFNLTGDGNVSTIFLLFCERGEIIHIPGVRSFLWVVGVAGNTGWFFRSPISRSVAADFIFLSKSGCAIGRCSFGGYDSSWCGPGDGYCGFSNAWRRAARWEVESGGRRRSDAAGRCSDVARRPGRKKTLGCNFPFPRVFFVICGGAFAYPFNQIPFLKKRFSCRYSLFSVFKDSPF
ncbi:hypothetical protein BS78_08G076200, partial [Paspalum vaginatum]